MDGIFSFCPWCGQDLPDRHKETRWIHDIIHHRGYWEYQTQIVDTELLMMMLYEIVEHYHGKTREIER